MLKIFGASFTIGAISSYFLTKVTVLPTPEETAMILLITFPIMSLIAFVGIIWALLYVPKPKQKKNKRRITGVVGIKVGPLIIGEQVGEAPEVTVKDESKYY